MSYRSSVLACASLVAIGAIAASGPALAQADGCGGAPETASITMMADWLPWASQGPMVAAQQAGYYADRGLEVDIVSPANPADPIKLVASGQVEFSLTYVPEIMLAHEAGIPVISVATTLRVLSSGLFFLADREIEGPADLAGMTLGVGPKQDAQAFLDTVLEAGGLTRDDVEVVDPGYAHIPMILSGQIDAAHGLTYSEGMAAAEAEGEDAIRWLLYSDFGVPAFYYQVLAANTDWIEANPNTTCHFLAGTMQGLEDWLADPTAALEQIATANEQFTPEQHLGIYKGTEGHWVVDGVALRQDASVWSEAAEWARHRGLIAEDLPPETYFTNDYLAAE